MKISEMLCAICDKPAACVGCCDADTYDPACDECCGHGNEDGHCIRCTTDESCAACDDGKPCAAVALLVEDRAFRAQPAGVA